MAAPKGNSNAKGNRGGTGRPTVYDARCVSAARELASLGATDFKIAQGLGIALTTLYQWRARHPEFHAACEPSEEEKLAAMKRSLFHRGMGYSHESEKILVVDKEVVRVPFTEHYPPDVGAMKLYLVSKSKGEFTDSVQVEQSGGVTVRVTGGLPTDEGEEK